MPRRTTDFRGLADPSRIRLLGVVQETPGSTVKMLAEATGLHVNTVREHLQVLVAEGLVAAEPVATGTRGRPPTAYRAVDDIRLNAVAQRRVERAREHGDILRRLDPAAKRPETLSDDDVHQLDALYEHLDDAGLEPTLDEESLTVDIAPCPYYPLGAVPQEFVCSVHSRILQDTLAQVPGSLELESLRPYVTSEVCLVVLQDSDPAGHACTTHDRAADESE